jgi:type III restriction enzyme
MTTDTSNCDRVADWLQERHPDLKGKVLVIHTNKSGDIAEGGSSKADKLALDALRKQSREIDSWDSPYTVVVSVMVLREGWDVRNVTTIVGLRPFKAASNILPEQTIGRGLRRMFFGRDVKEQVSVLGTEGFLEFVETIKNEGVELERRPMGEGSQPVGPMVIEIDRANPDKDIAALDIELPKLKPRIERQFYRFEEIDGAELPAPRLDLRMFTEAEQREIVFRDIHTDEISHVTQLDAGAVADWRNVVGWFAKSIKDDLRLQSGPGDWAVLFGKLKQFIEDGLFATRVSLDDPNVLRNLSEVAVTRALFDTIKGAINRLTIHDSGDTHVIDRIKLSETRPQVVRRRDTIEATKSLMNKVTGDNAFELAFASFLESAGDVQAFYKNSEATNFTIEYQSAGGGIVRDYRPDFIARDTAGVIWIIETKGREDLEDPRKWERLKLWCDDASAQDAPHRYRALFVRQDSWDRLLNPVRTLSDAEAAFA